MQGINRNDNIFHQHLPYVSPSLSQHLNTIFKTYNNINTVYTLPAPLRRGTIIYTVQSPSSTQQNKIIYLYPSSNSLPKITSPHYLSSFYPHIFGLLFDALPITDYYL